MALVSWALGPSLGKASIFFDNAEDEVRCFALVPRLCAALGSGSVKVFRPKALNATEPQSEAQPKKKADPHLIVVKHPVGGLNAAELEDRIHAAFEGLKLEMKI